MSVPNTYPEMNEKIVDILRIDNEDMAGLYAAKRIEELESSLAAAKAEIERLNKVIMRARVSFRYGSHMDGSGYKAGINILEEALSQGEAVNAKPLDALPPEGQNASLDEWSRKLSEEVDAAMVEWIKAGRLKFPANGEAHELRDRDVRNRALEEAAKAVEYYIVTDKSHIDYNVPSLIRSLSWRADEPSKGQREIPK